MQPTKKEDFPSYLCSYNGPHNLIFFLSPEEVKRSYATNNWMLIDIPDAINSSDALMLYPFFAHELQKTVFELFVKKIFEWYGAVSFETLCLLLSYAGLVGTKNIDQFFSLVGNKIIVPDQSLFSLAQDFLAGKASNFFKKWLIIEEHYQHQFWVTFWSNQLFRAQGFVAYMKKKDHINAKAIGARNLPFSFIERDWRRYQNNTVLIDAHQHLCDLDSHIKLTSYPHAFDIFFARFFSVQYVSSELE